MQEIRTTWVTLQVADETTLRAYAAWPQEAQTRAGLLVFQEVFGVNAHIREIAECPACEGYLVFGPGTLPAHGTGIRGLLSHCRGRHASPAP